MTRVEQHRPLFIRGLRTCLVSALLLLVVPSARALGLAAEGVSVATVPAERRRTTREAFLAGGRSLKFRGVVQGEDAVLGPEVLPAPGAPELRTRNGTAVLLQASAAVAHVNPYLFATDSGRVRFRTSPELCVAANSAAAAGEAVDLALATCDKVPALELAVINEQLVLGGASEQRCLDLQKGASVGDIKLATRDCKEAAVGWLVDGPRLRLREDPNRCLAVRDGWVAPGAAVLLQACDEASAVANWIIIGAGASGCAAAAALVDAGESVMVIERGDSDRNMPDTRQVSTWPRVVNSGSAEHIRWSDGTWGAVAKVLGGGTSVNGGLFIEETPDWVQDAFGPAVDPVDLHASYEFLAGQLATPITPTTFGEDFAQALNLVGLGNADRQNPSLMRKEGAWVPYATINTSAPGDWPRTGAAELLHQREGLPQLEVVTLHTVSKIAFSGNRAVGVHATRTGGICSWITCRTYFPATKGVILASGAIYTPQLLQMSGIGDAAHLSHLGVEPVVEGLPVGENFIDRPVLTRGVWSSKPLPRKFIGYAMAADTKLGLTVETEAGGTVASDFAIASLALVPPANRHELLRMTFRLLFATPLSNIMNNMMQLVALQHNPYSRGKVRAVSTDPFSPPEVTPNFFQDPRDMEKQLTALEELTKVLETPVIQQYAAPKAWVPPGLQLPDALSCLTKRPDQRVDAIVLPCEPPPNSATDRWQEYLKNTRVSSYHYFGTAAAGSVVEGPTFLVRGTQNVHVVDASVFPKPTLVNPQGTIMAIGHYIGKQLARQV